MTLSEIFPIRPSQGVYADTRREMKFPVPASVFLRLHRCLVVLSLTMKGTSF